VAVAVVAVQDPPAAVVVADLPAVVAAAGPADTDKK
jgi:hypothetical protein